MERFPLSKSSRKQAELWNCSLVHILSSWAFSFFNLYFCFMLIGITCWDHILDSLIFCLFVWFTPTCLKRSFFLPHCSHSAMLQKKKKKKTTLKKKRSLKWQIPNGQKSLWKTRMANAELAAPRNPQPPPSLNGSSISSQGGGVLCVCKAMYSVPSLLL